MSKKQENKKALEQLSFREKQESPSLKDYFIDEKTGKFSEESFNAFMMLTPMGTIGKGKGLMNLLKGLSSKRFQDSGKASYEMLEKIGQGAGSIPNLLKKLIGKSPTNKSLSAEYKPFLMAESRLLERASKPLSKTERKTLKEVFDLGLESKLTIPTRTTRMGKGNYPQVPTHRIGDMKPYISQAERDDLVKLINELKRMNPKLDRPGTSYEQLDEFRKTILPVVKGKK
tara:strand:- start:984 stop:1670 length:687 start_codon:yes stop_codon:yes gene_type:complete